MFGIPGKQAVSITDRAAKQIQKLMTNCDTKGLRVGVKTGGCAGMEYTMEYVNEIDPNDEVVTHDGATVMIAPNVPVWHRNRLRGGAVGIWIQIQQPQRHRSMWLRREHQIRRYVSLR